jgi:hypothetical protein
MKYLNQFFQNVKASPKTSATGIAGLVGSITTAVHNPSVLSTGAWWAVLFVSGGLLFAPDAGAKTPPTSPA